MIEVNSNKTFEENCGGNKIVIGNSDAKEEFQAHVKMKFWGEDYISLYKEGVKGEPSLKDDILTLDLHKRKLQWLKDGANLKWIETLNEKPVSNEWSLKISDANQFSYCYQMPFSELSTDIRGSSIEYFTEDGVDSIRLVYPPGGSIVCDERPLDIDGSIAVYHKTKRDNKYRVGKVFHIPRPKAVDNDGNWVWCDIQVKDGIYTRTIPQKFLDDAIYPVIINDTFGTTGNGSSKASLSADYFYANYKGSPASNGSATSMSLRGDVSAGTQKMTLGFWNDNTGEPGTLVKDTGEITVTITDQWWSDNLDAAASISSGSSYWLGKNSDGVIRTYYDTDSQSTYSEASVYVAGTLDDMTAASSESSTDRIYSIYITYTPSAGGNAGIMTTNKGCWGPTF